MNKKLACLCIAALNIFGACSTKSNCPYFDGINVYFEKTFNIKLTEANSKGAYYLVPLESCENCIYQNLLALDSVSDKKLTVIFVGKNFHSEWDTVIMSIKRKQSFLIDENKDAYDYETGLNKPLLIVVKSGNCHLVRNFTEEQLSELNDILVML